MSATPFWKNPNYPYTLWYLTKSGDVTLRYPGGSYASGPCSVEEVIEHNTTINKNPELVAALKKAVAEWKGARS